MHTLSYMHTHTYTNSKKKHSHTVTHTYAYSHTRTHTAYTHTHTVTQHSRAYANTIDVRDGNLPDNFLYKAVVVLVGTEHHGGGGDWTLILHTTLVNCHSLGMGQVVIML